MKVIIVGAVVAGAKTAAKLKRLQPMWDIVIYTQDTYVSYSECGMPYYIASDIEDIKKLIIRTKEEFEKSGIEVHLQHKVLEIIPAKKQLLIENLLTDDKFYEHYDKLVIATGAKPFVPEIKNINLENVFTLRTIEDAVNLKKKLLNSERAIIIGGGYIGLELMEAAVKQGVKPILIERHETILSFCDKEISLLIEDYINQRNSDKAKIITNEAVVEFVGENEFKGVLLDSGQEIAADMVVICAGVRPNVDLIKGTNIKLGRNGAISVNERMETDEVDIWACGDCVEKINMISGQQMWLPLGSTANKEGRCAAMNIAGYLDEFKGILNSAVVKYFGYTVSVTGLSEKEALKSGFNPVSVLVKRYDKARYMPNLNTIMVKLVADKETQKLLGAQGIGTGDVDKRINTLTSALLAGLTVKEFLSNDLTYAPPYSASIDLVLAAAKELQSKLDGNL